MKDLIKKLDAPIKIQRYIETLEYNKGKRISIKDVYEKKLGDCLETACFASYTLTKHKVQNWIMDLSTVRDEDHVLCVFKIKGLYGSIAQSKFLGLRYRQPVYKTLRELAMSYFENYFNYYGEYTLRSMSIPLKINFEGKLESLKTIIELEKKLGEIKHVQLIPQKIKLPKVTKTKFEKEILIKPEPKKIGKEYREEIKMEYLKKLKSREANTFLSEKRAKQFEQELIKRVKK